MCCCARRRLARRPRRQSCQAAQRPSCVWLYCRLSLFYNTIGRLQTFDKVWFALLSCSSFCSRTNIAILQVNFVSIPLPKYSFFPFLGAKKSTKLSYKYPIPYNLPFLTLPSISLYLYCFLMLLFFDAPSLLFLFFECSFWTLFFFFILFVSVL